MLVFERLSKIFLQRVWINAPSYLRGIMMILISTFCAATMHVLVKFMSTQMHSFEVAFFRNLFGFLVLIPFIFRSRFRIFKTNNIKLHLIRGAMNTAAMLMFFAALGLVPLARVNALGFTAPIFMALLSVLFLGERFKLYRWLSIIMGFVGMLLILRPGIIKIEIGSLLVIGSALFWAMAMVIIKIQSRTESSLTIVAWMGLTTVTLSILPAIFYWDWPSTQQLLWLFAIGITGTGAQLAISQAFKEADTTVMMPFDFTKLLWAAFYGFWIFGEIPDLYTWIGGAIIFSSGILIAYREKKIKASQSEKILNV